MNYEGKMVELQKMQVKLLMGDALKDIASDKKKQQLYTLTDGKNTSSQIEKKLKMSSKTISQYWNEWHMQGLLVKVGKKYYNIEEYLKTI